MSTRVCSADGCAELVERGACATHAAAAATARARLRPSSAERGYGSSWRRLMAEWLPGKSCVDCAVPAEVGDHDPVDRATLVELGVPDPDDPRFLRPRCKRCHNKRTAREAAKRRAGATGAAPARRRAR